jgi:hypothetical protein
VTFQVPKRVRKGRRRWVTVFRPLIVKVDGQLAVNKATKESMYAGLGDSVAITDENGTPTVSIAIWVPLIEKAFAKLKGGYPNIGKGGSARAALGHLTGVPAKSIALKRKGKAVAALRQAIASRRPMVVSSKDARGDTNRAKALRKKMSSARIVSNHVYVVLDVKPNGSVRLYNPWGMRHPGTQSDEEPAGYITWEQFTAYYRSVTIAPLKPPASQMVAPMLPRPRARAGRRKELSFNELSGTN